MMYLFLKICSRIAIYYRGLRIYIYIVLCGGKCTGIPRVGKGVVWKYPPHSGIYFGKKVDVGAYCLFDFPKGSMVFINDNVKLTHGVVLACRSNLIIGNDTLIAEYTSIRDSTHGSSFQELIRTQECIVGKIVIGSDVWIGRSVLVLGKVNVAKGVVVGADSFVNRDLDKEYGIYAGCPAILKKMRK